MQPDSPVAVPGTVAPAAAVLRVLSLNMQVGLHSTRYRHYLTQAWRHVLPSPGAHTALNAIGALAAGYDVVALQEADAGSLRTSGLNQVAYLAARAGLPYWHAAVNRNLKPFAQHCLGVLSRDPMTVLRHCALPGWPPGRGALEVGISRSGCKPVRLIVAHLALGRASRQRQLGALADMVSGGDAILVGDFNCEPAEIASHPSIHAAGLRMTHADPTFPAWRPRRCLDHALVTPDICVTAARVLDDAVSDHCAVAIEIRLRTRAPE